MTENICFIPARGGSKRLKGKNLALFKGKSLIENAIIQAQESNLFNSIILSSDDTDSLSIGKKLGIELHHRVQNLSTDKVKIIEVLQNVIVNRPINEDAVVCLLLTTCPLRSVLDIQNAFKMFIEAGGNDPVVSVKRNETPIQLSWKMADDRLAPVFPDEYSRTTRKQDHFDTFSYNDAIIIDSARNFLDPTRNLFGKQPIPYIMPWERSIPIDYEFQLKIVQCFGDLEDKNA